MQLSLPDWSSDLSAHYLDGCIEIFTNELENAQRERSPTLIAAYAYLRGCARLARGDYLEGLRDLYLIEDSNLFPQKYIETIIVPRLADEHLLDLFIREPFYTQSPEWKKIGSSSSDVTGDWNVVQNALTYDEFSEHVHRLSIVLDKETTETLFKALLFWTDNSISKTLKNDRKLTNNTNKSPEPIKLSDKPSPRPTIPILEETLGMLNSPPLTSQTVTGSLTTPAPLNPSLPRILFELFLDIWQQTNAEKVRMNHHLPEDRQKQESILAVKLSHIYII
jgi:hypothetical protein